MKVRILLIVFVVALLQACNKGDYKPKEIVGETDVCEVCNMSIVHEDHAGQIALANGDYVMFDDIGCLIEYMNGIHPDDVGKAFIKDAKNNEWTDVKTAVYLYDQSFWTPMSYGVLAFQSKDAAEEWQKNESTGEILNYEDLANFEWGIHK